MTGSNTPDPCVYVEDKLIEALENMKKDKDREKHFRMRVKKGGEKVEVLRRAIIQMNPNYKFRVKVPHIPVVARERLAVVHNRANYGHHTKLAWKVLKSLKKGTYEELRDHAIEKTLIEKGDLRVQDALRMALYGMVRRGVINSVPGEGDTKTTFSMK